MYLDSKRHEDISKSAKADNYNGRKKIKLDKLASQEIFLEYEAKKTAAQKLLRTYQSVNLLY